MAQKSRLSLAVIVVLLSIHAAASAEPDWQIHAKWCTTDQGSSGRDYRNDCAQGVDQFESILSCQKHNPGAQAAIRAAGREQVDSFMLSYQPSVCRRSSVPTPNTTQSSTTTHSSPRPADGPYYVVRRNQCARPGEKDPAGSCEWRASGQSCLEAVQRITTDSIAKGGLCSCWDARWIPTGRTEWLQDGPCRGYPP